MSKPPKSLKGDGNFRGSITYAEAEKMIENSTFESQVYFQYLKLKKWRIEHMIYEDWLKLYRMLHNCLTI